MDLASMLHQHGKIFSESYLRLCWQQMLEAVHTIHEARIIHSDLKPANFVLVKGTIKLIDFGIAGAIQADTTNLVRDNQIGTINFISPEALTDTSAGDGSNLCIKVRVVLSVNVFL
jgi:serine/threonine-protein kinase TTK/MPS1